MEAALPNTPFSASCRRQDGFANGSPRGGCDGDAVAGNVDPGVMPRGPPGRSPLGILASTVSDRACHGVRIWESDDGPSISVLRAGAFGLCGL